MKPIEFSFTATSDGQKVFGPIVPDNQKAMAAVNGILQNPVEGDFTVSGGFYINLSAGVNVGDVIHGSLFL